MLGVLPSTRPRRAVGMCATAAVLVGLSRVVLGYHWMTDAVGGWLVGLGYLAVVWLGGYTVCSSLASRRAVQR